MRLYSSKYDQDYHFIKACSCVIYLEGVHVSTELSTKHLSDVIRMLVRQMVLIDVITSAVSLGF